MERQFERPRSKCRSSQPPRSCCRQNARRRCPHFRANNHRDFRSFRSRSFSVIHLNIAAHSIFLHTRITLRLRHHQVSPPAYPPPASGEHPALYSRPEIISTFFSFVVFLCILLLYSGPVVHIGVKAPADLDACNTVPV